MSIENFILSVGEPAEGGELGGTGGAAEAADAALASRLAGDTPSPDQGTEEVVAPEPGAATEPEFLDDALLDRAVAYETARGEKPITIRQMRDRLVEQNRRLAQSQEEAALYRRALEGHGTGEPPPEKPVPGGDVPPELDAYKDDPFVKTMIRVPEMLENIEKRLTARERAEQEVQSQLSAQGAAQSVNAALEAELAKEPQFRDYPNFHKNFTESLAIQYKEKLADPTLSQQEKWQWGNDPEKIKQLAAEAFRDVTGSWKVFEAKRFQSRSKEVAPILKAGQAAKVMGPGGQSPVIAPEQTKLKGMDAQKAKNEQYLRDYVSGVARETREGLRRS